MIAYFSLHKKTRSVIAIVIIISFTFLSANFVSHFLQNRTVKLIHDECMASTGQSVGNYVENFEIYREGNISSLGKENSRMIATTVTNTMDTYLTGTNVKTISVLTKNVEESVNNQISSMQLSLSSEEQKVLTSGITALVITSVYKAISDRGLVSSSDLNYMRVGLEERITGVEDILSNQSANLTRSIHELQNVIAETDLLSQNQGIAIEFLKNNLEELEKILASALEDSDKKEEELDKVITNIMMSLEQAGLTSIEQEKLKTTVSSISEHLTNLDNYSKKEIVLLQNTIFDTRTQLEQQLEQEVIKVDALEKNVLNKTEIFTQNLLSLQSIQTNLENSLNILSNNVGEGSVDERITNLCNEIALSLGSELSSTNQLVREQIDILDNQIKTTENSLNTEINYLRASLTAIEGNIDDLTDEQEENLKKATESLTSRIYSTESNLSNLSSSLSNATVNLEELINGNTTNITSLIYELNSAKTELTEQMEIANESTKLEINNTISDINNLIVELTDNFDTDLNEFKKEFLQTISSLNSEHNEILNNTKSELENQISSCASTSALALEEAKSNLSESLINLHSNLTTVNTNISNLQTNLDALENELISSLNLKADKEDVDTALTNINSTLNNKANEADVDAALNTKADKDTVNSTLSSKADKTNVNALSNKINELEKKLKEIVTYSETDGKPTIVINIP